MGQSINKFDNYRIARSKAELQFEQENPDIIKKLKDYESLSYLNIIDKTIYLIRLREFYHTRFIDILGPDPTCKINAYEVSDDIFGLEKPYLLNDYILDLNKELVQNISDNLKTAKLLYQIGNSNLINNRPYSSLLKDPQRLIISIFIYPIRDWLKILKLEIEKQYIQKRNKNDTTKTYDVSELRNALRAFTVNIKERIGSNQLKIYDGRQVYHNIHLSELGYVIDNSSLSKLLGNLNYEDMLREIKNIHNHREALHFKASVNELYPIFKHFLTQYQSLKESDYKKSLKLFLLKHTMSPMEIEQNWMNVKNVTLDFIDNDNVSDFCGFLCFLRDKKIAVIKQNQLAGLFKILTCLDKSKFGMRGVLSNSDLGENLKKELMRFSPLKNLVLKTQ